MTDFTEFQASSEDRIRRGQWIVREGSLGDEHLESGLDDSTPEERLAMVWPLTIQAWAFQGVDVAESRLPRHLMRLTRREC
jgi:hypothetical protein